MITIKALPQAGVTELHIKAPFSPEDFETVDATFERLRQHEAKIDLLATVDSIELPSPRALWEDLKLAKYIGNIRRVAVVTDLAWYGALVEVESALLPGIDIKRFKPGEREAALAWLQARAS